MGGRVVYRAEGPELDFALSRLYDFLLVTARDDVRKEISVWVDQETLDNIIAVGSALESLARSENAKIRRRIYGQELLVRIPSTPGKNTVGRLPERERRFVGNEETARRRDNRSSGRRLRRQIPFRDDFAFLILRPRGIKWRAHPPVICLRSVLRRNFHAFNEDAQVLLAKYRRFGQTNFEGTEGTIAGIFEFIGDLKMDAAGRGAGNENLCLPIGKLIARAKRMNAARRQEYARAQDNAKKDSRPRFHKQDEVILPGRSVRVKSC
ncbi:MAG TPA: hypothetical protein VKS00_06580 [Candidatus Acidoferrales bacterium]|nr:hypothetical protein [Candidatus Acidoferrales bacterium]